MKKIITLVIGCIMAFGCFGLAACEINVQNEKLSIVCTIFPEYDWVNQILGEDREQVEVTLLLDNGVDLHSYQPSVQDIAVISKCDMFIYVGGESDAWVDKALKNALNKDMTVINLLETLGDRVKDEEELGGLAHDHDHDHDHEVEKDEHVWLSLKNAEIVCEKICTELKRLDEENAENYEANWVTYQTELRSLDTEYQAAVDRATYRTLVFGDRFPFRYLAEDYWLDYYAAFSGCSAETEASFETIVFLAQKVDELSLPAVCEIEGSTHQIAQTVKNNTAAKNQKILTFDSMQSRTLKDVSAGCTYLSAMENNLNTLKQALDA